MKNTLFLFIFLAGLGVCCRPDTKEAKKQAAIITPPQDTVIRNDTVVDEPTPVVKKKAEPKIVGDTVWVYAYGQTAFYDSIKTEKYNAWFSTVVDTTDYIIDTVPSKMGSRLVIGYNHYYTLRFEKSGKKWFTFEFNKKEHFHHLLEGTEFWIESNLDVFRNLTYNKKYNKFVIEFDINPRYNYGSVYYVVFDTQGQIDYIGTSSSWGGGGPDGNSFITQDLETYLTCYEIYYFAADTSLGISDYTLISANIGELDSTAKINQLHGLRQLKNNTFLTVYNYDSESQSAYNAFVLRNDSTLLSQFRYEGILEEMDAMLLYTENKTLSESYLYDSQREVLICISQYDSTFVFEFPLASMRKINSDTVPPNAYHILDFEAFGSYQFLIDTSNHKIYQNEEVLR